MSVEDEDIIVSQNVGVSLPVDAVSLQMSKMPINVDGWKSEILSLFYVRVSSFCVISLTTLIMWDCVNMCVCTCVHACLHACLCVCVCEMYTCVRRRYFLIY